MVEVKAPVDSTYAPVPGEESRGEGVNANVYWVARDLLGAWTKLPDLKGEHVAAARKFKKALTGDLDAEVEAYPFFGEKERYLIRAQIARITASTVVVPKGIFKEAENSTRFISHPTVDREIEYEESPTAPGFAELKTLENWVHLNPHLLLAGRTKHILPPGTQNAEEELDKLTQNEPYIARLRALNEDESTIFALIKHRVRNVRNGVAGAGVRGRAELRQAAAQGGHHALRGRCAAVLQVARCGYGLSGNTRDDKDEE